MISLQQVRKEYPGGTVAVHALDLDVAAGEVAVLIGPSGCGKTTTMRMINRLVEPTAGRILLDGADVTKVDAVGLRRSMGYVIQQVGLFPHQTVQDNVATVPRLLGWGRDRVRARSREMLELVGLDPDRFARRYPHELSGGQRQRVGVARALAADPPVLLMDEPFGAVDPVARDRLQVEFLRLQEQMRKTVVFVTHDMDEAIRVGDRVAVMREGGHLEQYAAPAELFAAPATPFVAEFVGADQGTRRLSVLTIARDAVLPWPSAPAGESVPDEHEDVVVVDSGDRVSGWRSPAGSASDDVRPAAVVRLGDTLDTAMSGLVRAGGPGVVVVDENDRYVGVLTADAVVAIARVARAAPIH